MGSGIHSGSITYCKQTLNTSSATVQCSDCYLKQKQLQLNDPVERVYQDPAVFQSMKQSCGIPTASYPVTYIPSPTATSTPSALPACTSSYIVKAGDTGNSIAAALQVSTDRLLQYNSIPLDNNGTLPTGKSLCLDQVSKCRTKQVVVADTCSTLFTLIGYGLDKVTFRSWNPTIGLECGNLKNMVGKLICISPPGQTTPYSLSTATLAPTSTNTTSTYAWVPATETIGLGSNFTTKFMFPSNSVSVRTVSMTLPAASEAAAVEARLAYCPFGSEEEDEWQADLAEDEYRLQSWDLPIECMEMHWDKYCTVNIATTIQLPPSTIPSSCSPTVSTVTPDGFVNPPAPTNSGSPSLCNKWYVVKTGEDCSAVASKNTITFAQFYAWNPSVGSDCRLMRAAFAYCVRVWVEPMTTSSSTTTRAATTTVSEGPPGPTGSGTSTTCTKYHLRQSTDTCDSIATLYGIIVSRFRQLNRSVTSACDNLITGNAYCVG